MAVSRVSNPQDPPSGEIFRTRSHPRLTPPTMTSPDSPQSLSNQQQLQQRRRGGAVTGPPNLIVTANAANADQILLDDEDDTEESSLDRDSRSANDDWWHYSANKLSGSKDLRHDSRYLARRKRRNSAAIADGSNNYASSSLSPNSSRRPTMWGPIPPPSSLSLGCFGVVLLVLSGHRLFSLYMTHRQWINAPITYLPRTCPRPEYTTVRDYLLSLEQQPQQQRQAEENVVNGAVSMPLGAVNINPRICLTTLTDSRSTSKLQRFLRWRNFDGILELTWQNKYAYAVKHGYTFYDGSQDIDGTRPPAWSKIKAVQHLLKQQIAVPSTEATSSVPSLVNKCDYVMWGDADTVIMNSDLSVLDFLPTDPNIDLLVGSDNGSGYNSGVFVVKNTPWGHEFMNRWWNMEDFVRPPGFSLSGDNNAMKALLSDLENTPAVLEGAGSGRTEFDVHVAVPARCTFNSFAKFLTVQESLDVLDDLESQEWYLNPNYYHKGDFIAHTPGYDNKQECLQLLLNEAK